MKYNIVKVSNKFSNRIFVKNLYNKLNKLPKFLANLFLISMYFFSAKTEKKYSYSFVYQLINS